MEKHFTKIFWLLSVSLFLAYAYIFLITFVPIPKENIRFADTSQGFLLGTVIGGVIGFFITGSPNSAGKKPENTGKTTASIEANIVTEPVNHSPDDQNNPTNIQQP